MGMVFPVSTHNYEICYWLAAAGMYPGMYSQLFSGWILLDDAQRSRPACG
jgi:hypothetical protein